MGTLRGGISDTVNEINKLLLKTQDPEEEKKLRDLRRMYFDLWQRTIRTEIDNRTSEFTDAIRSLNAAHDAAVEAKEKTEKIALAIDRATSAVSVVEKVLKLASSPLA